VVFASGAAAEPQQASKAPNDLSPINRCAAAKHLSRQRAVEERCSFVRQHEVARGETMKQVTKWKRAHAGVRRWARGELRGAHA